MKPYLKFLFVALAFVAIAITVDAQSVRLNAFNKDYPPVGTDTVTNTGTGIVQFDPVSGGGNSTTIVVRVTKISGTVGGTITLQGSLDGTNFKALNTPNTVTALATITATDATNTYHWILLGSPFRHYRISWTGTGTMSATLDGDLLKH